MIKQNFIAIDLELNQPSNKIIQVGVAIGNAYQNPKDYIVQKWYVDPNEPLDLYITGLTGITDRDIRSKSYSYNYISQELNELIKEHEPWLNAVVWGYNDVGVLRKEFEQNSVEFKHLGGRWIDLKTIYNFMMFSDNSSPKGGLAEAMLKFDIVFDGTQHRADIDAFNTLKFYFELMKRQSLMIDFSNENNYNTNTEDLTVTPLSKNFATSDNLWELDNARN